MTETGPNDRTIRELAIQAATRDKLNSYTKGYTPDILQARRIAVSFAKTCSPTAKLANICDTGLVKQIAFVQPNYKIGIMTHPFITQDATTNKDIFVGSLGDSLDIIYPVRTRLIDATADIIGVCPSRARAELFKLAISTSNPIEVHGPPPPEDSVTMPEPPGPDRINVVITDEAHVPCFVAMPKILPLTGGYGIPNDPVISTSTLTFIPGADADSLVNLWYQTIRYGMVENDNYSIHALDKLFVYEDLQKDEFNGPNRALASRCTVHVDALAFDTPEYQQVEANMRQAKENALFTYGSKLLATENNMGSMIPAFGPHVLQNPQGPPVPAVDSNGMSFFEGFAKALQESTAKSLTGTERERASEASETAGFYSILWASSVNVIQEDGTTMATIVPAKLNKQFLAVLQANKNSKEATRALQDAVETMAAELGSLDDKFTSSANLIPAMFDQPMTAAIHNGQWEHVKTVLNPDGIKTKIGAHHFAPPKTNSAAYRTRQQGKSLLVQQDLSEPSWSL